VTTNGGNVVVKADDDGNAGDAGAGGGITMEDGALIDAGAGTITMSADEDILLAGLVTTNNTGAAVNILSRSKSILDNGDADSDIVALGANAVVTLEAADYIGRVHASDVIWDPEDVGYTGNPLDTEMTHVVATVHNLNGEISIDNTYAGTFTVDSVTPSTGQNASAWFRNTGNLTATILNINDGGEAGDNLGLISTAGSVLVPNMVYSTTGTIKFEAATIGQDVTINTLADLDGINADTFILKSGVSENVTNLTATKVDARVYGTSTDLYIGVTAKVPASGVTFIDSDNDDGYSLAAGRNVDVDEYGGHLMIEDKVLGDSGFVRIEVQDADTDMNAAKARNTSITAGTYVDLWVNDGNINLASDAANKDLQIKANSGNVTIGIEGAGTGAGNFRAITMGDGVGANVSIIAAGVAGGLVEATDLSRGGNNGNVYIYNYNSFNGAGTIPDNWTDIVVAADASITAYKLDTDPVTGKLHVVGDVDLLGNVEALEDHYIKFEATSADINIYGSTVAAGSLILDPGGNDVIIHDGASVTVNAAATPPPNGDLTIQSTDNFLMTGNATVNVDGSMFVYANLMDMSVDSNINAGLGVDININGGNTKLSDIDAGGDITIDTNGGTLDLLGIINANGNNVTVGGDQGGSWTAGSWAGVAVTSFVGDITDSNGGAMDFNNVSKLTISGSGKIGSRANAIEINASDLDIQTTGASDIALVNDPDGQVRAEFNSIGGNLYYSQAGGNLVLVDWGVDGDNRSVNLGAGNGLIDPPDNVTIAADVVAGNFTVEANGYITQGPAAAMVTVNGDLTLTAAAAGIAGNAYKIQIVDDGAVAVAVDPVTGTGLIVVHVNSADPLQTNATIAAAINVTVGADTTAVGGTGQAQAVAATNLAGGGAGGTITAT
ncbi:MAG: hypothetical protein JEZ11_28410, partial [Desulfobacterales bacterium]|nr:hypothetical protein [Desulfobacterales bacterium]